MARWDPIRYFREGKKCGYSEPYLRALVQEGARLQSRGLPVVFTLGHLGAITDVSYHFLRQVVSREINPYRTFFITKRSGGKRRIQVPADRILRVQRWINRNILLSARPHSASSAFCPGSSPLRNAQQHCDGGWLVKIDFRDFFETISEKRVFRVFADLGYPSFLSFQFARLCTSVIDKKILTTPRHAGVLPQGAPTSPILANLVCRDFDTAVTNIALDFELSYTRYADDLVFSGIKFDREKARHLIRRVELTAGKHGLITNSTKTRVIPPAARKIVTGLVVNGTRPHLPKEFRDRLRAHLFFARKFGVGAHCRKRRFDSILGFKNHLSGLISHASSIEPAFGEKCRKEFQEIQWP